MNVWLLPELMELPLIFLLYRQYQDRGSRTYLYSTVISTANVCVWILFLDLWVTVLQPTNFYILYSGLFTCSKFENSCHFICIDFIAMCSAKPRLPSDICHFIVYIMPSCANIKLYLLVVSVILSNFKLVTTWWKYAFITGTDSYNPWPNVAFIKV
jgi:hypothetical protein